MGGLEAGDDPAAAVERLAGSRAPWLFGVRHHSPACAAALPALLDEVGPAVVAIELPADLGGWIEWLGADAAKAPLALAAVGADGRDLGFYPFADFSPELAAIRWARAHGVPVVAIDLPASARGDAGAHDGRPVGITDRLVERHQTEDSEALWDQLVESRAVGAAPERIRRAALLYGWALRLDHARGGGVAPRDLRREAHMRQAIAEAGRGGKRVAAIIGAFHAAALLDPPLLWRDPGPAAAGRGDIVSSLIPYGFELLDSRSGYPAGIRDPMWQQRRWTALAASLEAAGPAIRSLTADVLVEIVRHVRRANHPAGVPDAQAAWAMATSLAHLRGLPAPGHREVVEAAQSALTQGELLGRGRIVARAMERVMVGRRRGELAHGTPRSGLHPHVIGLCAALRLPGPTAASAEAADLRLDPLRSALDRRRHVALNRLAGCGVPYGVPQAGTAVGGVETLTQTWTVRWQPSTDAMLELAGIRGVTLRQAATGALRAERARLTEEDGAAIGKLIGLTIAAAECGLPELVAEWLTEIGGPLLGQATLPDLIGLISFVERARAGHVVGLPDDAAAAVAGEIDVFALPASYDDAAVVAAAVRCVEGLGGSSDVDDARALLELVRRLTGDDGAFLGDARLAWAIAGMIRDGSPLMQGAATVLATLLDRLSVTEAATAIGGWLDVAADSDGQRALASRLRGALAVAGPIVEASPILLDELARRIEAIADADFLRRLPALRDGFDVLSTAARRRLLDVLAERLGARDARGGGLDVTTEDPPELLALYAAADAEGRRAMDLVASGVDLAAGAADHARGASPASTAAPAAIANVLPPIERWRLVLGHQREKLGAKGARAARALDELYGTGHGEGSRGGLGPGGGQESGFPTAREWTDEIEALFGTAVREEVTAQAASRGRVQALFEADPDDVTPSIDLLEQILSLRGGLAESHLARLRPLIRRIVDALVAELAVRVRPALVGLASPRATRRAAGPLHLPRTIAANLHTARTDGDRISIAPETLYFKTRARRHLDWRVILIVDVSGSMEPSVIYSAMMAAILAAVPWVDVKFVAFNTDVVDLSDRVGDPLALLLEVEVGGGTHIARALRYARGLVEIPQRTIALVVSDFEEGFAIEPMLGEVRTLVESGVTCLGLAALDDRGAPRYAVPIAELVAGCGMPVAALTPLELARWVGEQIR